MIRFARFTTPLGSMYALAQGDALLGVYFDGARHAPPIDAAWHEDSGDALLHACATQVGEYFAGRRTRFELPLARSGTDFQQRVWRAIAAIAPGATASYAQLARTIGAPDCARAVGAATGRNPWSLVVPCHRVVGSRGELTGYAGGLERKARLLAMEAAPQQAAA